MYHFLSAFVHSCIGTSLPPPLPPTYFPLAAVVGVDCCVDWPGLVRPAPVPFPHEAARRVDDQFPLFLAALDNGTLSTPDSEEGLSVDPSVALYALMSSSRYWAHFFFRGWPVSGLSPPYPTSRTSRDGSAVHLSSVGTALARRRWRLRVVVSTLSNCVEGLGGQYVVVGALSELEANIRSEVVLVYRSEISKMPLAEIPSHTPVQQDVHHLGPYQAHR